MTHIPSDAAVEAAAREMCSLGDECDPDFITPAMREPAWRRWKEDARIVLTAAYAVEAPYIAGLLRGANIADNIAQQLQEAGDLGDPRQHIKSAGADEVEKAIRAEIAQLPPLAAAPIFEARLYAYTARLLRYSNEADRRAVASNHHNIILAALDAAASNAVAPPPDTGEAAPLQVVEVLREAHKKIAAHGYGLQGLLEDNEPEEKISEYWASECRYRQQVARDALAQADALMQGRAAQAVDTTEIEKAFEKALDKRADATMNQDHGLRILYYDNADKAKNEALSLIRSAIEAGGTQVAQDTGEAARAVLRQLEWSACFWVEGRMIRHCPSCGFMKHIGHERDCELARALAEPAGQDATKEPSR